MKKPKQKIFSPKWLEYHPYDNSVSSDIYYVQLCNKVVAEIEKTMEGMDDENYLFFSEDEQITLACILTCYFEDVISQTNIWNTFTRLNKEKTGKWLPFSYGKEYEPEEINVDDLRFLIWHTLCQITSGQIPISPEEPFFTTIANAVYPIFDEEYETAPENYKLKEFFTIDEEMTNLNELQPKFFWLGVESYLFCFNSKSLEEEINEVIEIAKENDFEDHIGEMINMVLTDFSYNNKTEFFALTAAKWLAHILGKENGLYEPLLSLSEKKSGYFIFQEQDSMYARFKHVATGEVIQVTNRSLVGFPKDMKSPEVILYAGFVQWEGEWWFLGDIRSYELSDELVENISGREEELELFGEEDNESFGTYNEQLAYAQELVERTHADDPEEELTDIEWELLYDDELSNEFFEKATEKGDLKELHFPGENGEKLWKENLPFVLNYFRRK